MLPVNPRGLWIGTEGLERFRVGTAYQGLRRQVEDNVRPRFRDGR